GAAVRQGPHHAAQKSTSTGTFDLETISWNCSGPTSSGSPVGGIVALQDPQRPSSARCSSGMRFFLPQEAQMRMTPSWVAVAIASEPRPEAELPEPALARAIDRPPVAHLAHRV